MSIGSLATRKDTDLRGVLSIVIILIVYGSLYPWDFIFDSHVSPVRVLLTSWIDLLRNDFPGRDFVVNIALYIPLGIAGFLALRKAVTVITLALVLSTCIELIQAYHPFRFSNAVDLVANVAGTVLGVSLAKIFSGNLHRLAGRWRFIDSPHPVPLALLLFWAAATLFPFFPVTGLTTLLNKVAYFWNEPIRISSVVSAAVVFFTLGRLLIGASLSSPAAWLGGAACLVPTQLLLETQQPSCGAVIGAIVGCVVFLFAGRRPYASQAGAVALLSVILYRGLLPFDFQADRSSFGWIPFASLLESENGQRGLTMLLDKCFYYGSAVWSLQTSGCGLTTATMLTAAALGLIETAQLWLPGRTPESTDVVLAALLGFAFRATSGEGSE